jgi:hypothetical protein
MKTILLFQKLTLRINVELTIPTVVLENAYKIIECSTTKTAI